MSNLIKSSRKDFQAWITEQGEPSFRADQILRWLWKEKVQSFDEMSNISKALREKLNAHFQIRWPKILTAQNSNDGTIKYLLELDDGKSVECVWIPRADQNRVTVCVSSQVGCKMGCTFCMTGLQKTERNLTAGEIAAQILVLPNSDAVTNVVLMGMGEPFDNYDNVMSAIDFMTDPHLLEIGPRHITVSTSGLIPAIQKFFKETKCSLAISLNASNNEVRSQIMPVNRAYPIEKLMNALKEIARNRELRMNKDFMVTFEYILMDRVNDKPEHAEELARLVRGLPCKINLLLFNENPVSPFKRPSLERVEQFQRILRSFGVLNFLRASRGRDISAACGQLASENKRKQLLQISSSPQASL